MRFAFNAEQVAVFPIRTMCRALHVSPSGYYAWRERPTSSRERDDEVLPMEVEAVHEQSRGTYGGPRVTRELHEQGRCVSKKRVAILMKKRGLRGKKRRRFHKTTGDCWDNAVAESFFATIKGDELEHQGFPSHTAARIVIDDHITNFYNPLRRHSTLGYLSPDEFELRAQVSLMAASPNRPSDRGKSTLGISHCRAHLQHDCRFDEHWGSRFEFGALHHA